MEDQYKALLALSDIEKRKRFDEMAAATFSHLDGTDKLAELHPRRMLDIKRRIDGVDTWFDGYWLTNLMKARDGEKVTEYHTVNGDEK